MNSKINSKKCKNNFTPQSVYAYIINNCLDLTPQHEKLLNARGLTRAEAMSAGYRSWPVKRGKIVEALINHYGREAMASGGIPGLWRSVSGDWQLSGISGIAIPIRNQKGEIVGIKIRSDRSTSNSKYILLSSNPKKDKKTGAIKYPEGTAAPLQIHYPLNRPRKIKLLRITEGEIKADVATALTGEYTISLPGINSWRLALDAIRALKPERVTLAFDADKDEASTPQAYIPSKGRDDANDDEWSLYGDSDGSPQPGATNAVAQALANLYTVLTEEREALGIDEGGISIEHWDREWGKGIDDVLLAGHSDKIVRIAGDDAEQLARKLLGGDDGSEDWVYVIGTKRFFHTKTLLELDKEQYADRFLHMEKGNPASNALRNPALRKVDAPIYLPGHPPFLTFQGRKVFNLWRKNPLEPKPGSVKPFLDHCQYILPDEYECNVFLDWLAYNVQFPGKKILWAVLLQGVSGTGKSYFGSLMRWILGPNNVSCPTNEVIHELYTAWQKSCQLVVVEEIMARGRLELMNKLKPIITQETTVVREMHKAAYEQPNVFNLLMFTNHEDAIIIDRHDRRYCVLFSPAQPVSPAYYEKLWSWTKGHLPQILNFFHQRDLSQFNPTGHAPMTAGKKIVIAESVPPLQAWIEECIQTEGWPFMSDLVCVNHLMACMPQSLRWITPQSLSKALKACGARQLTQVKLSHGNSVRLWSVRRHEVWASVGKEALAAEYERWGTHSEPGGNPLAESAPL